jgi:2-dehydropantoate 2-reductase
MSALKIAIIGAGGVGGYLTAKLVQNDYDVTLVAKGKNFEAIRENGLQIIEYKQNDFTVYPYVVEHLDCEVYDVVFIATKSCDYESACKSIEYSVDKNTLIIPLSDGLGVSSTLKSYLPSCVIGDGLIHIISELKSPGVIHRKSFTFYLEIACRQENINLKVLEQLLNFCDLRTSSKKSLRYERWKKYLFTSTMSMLTTYFDKPMGYVFKEKLELMLDVLLEIKKVANARDINITSVDIEKTVSQASHVEYETKTAMQVAFEKNRKTEFDLLIGYVVREANKLNIAIPQMEKIYNTLKVKTAKQ